MKNKIIKEISIKIFFALVHGLSSGIAVNCFLSPNDIYTGGITGLSQLFSGISAAPFRAPTWLWVLILNIPPAILSYFFTGKKFTLFSFFSIAFSSAAIRSIPSYTLTGEPILAAVFGGIFSGFGAGLCFRAGFSTGGVDFIIFFIRKRYGKTVGSVGVILNSAIALTVAIFYGAETALYSIIAIYISNKLLNHFYVQQNKVTVSIFTEHREKITRLLGKHSIHGVSYIENVYGGYTDKKLSLIISVISQYELLILKEVIKKEDPDAFVNVQQTSDVIGFFKREEIK